MELLSTTILIIAILLLTFLKTMVKSPEELRRHAGKQAPGPRGLPFIGNIHNVLGTLPPHHYLRHLSTIYGPIFRLKLGEINTLIISSAEAAREILKTHDLNFASRPNTATSNTIFYGSKDIVFACCGDFWRQMRRICMLELLSAKKVCSFRTIREEEISHLLQSISISVGEVVNLSSKFAALSNNITARAVVGGTCKEQPLFQLAVDEVTQYVSGFSVINLFPSIPGFINRITGWQKKLNQCGQKLDRIAEKILQEHVQKRAEFFNGCEEQDKLFIEEDMMDVLIRIQQDGGLQFPLSNDNIKAIVNDMLMAGSDTIATTMEWVMTELVRHPKVMRKVQREVRNVLREGDNTNMIVDEEAVRNKLHYLQVVIKETLRFHPPAPLLLPRESIERCEVMGYDVPAKTMVIVNAWAIGRDPKYWENPEEFWPERFEKSDVDFKGRPYFEFLPFGSGRRMCPGINFGLTVVELTIAYLLYYFDWEYKIKKGEQLDVTETFGVTAKRKFSLCLLANPHNPLTSLNLKLN
ncbi:Cytochrome P450 71D10 [Apostasia shenzhenica]|uniref:Cytochrome P450 71D10 n=1 Tax=Apostasia shenzhenica TaxID=1088818 RepID=A0A2I0B5B1_9ASPA|nr:Cytochrome P450 71D10 [Apostasia shenzhenica]